MSLPDFFSYGKLRASWAQVGKDTDPYLIGQTYTSPSIYPLGGQVGFTRYSRYGDPELKPEQTTSIEFGTDLIFLQVASGLILPGINRTVKIRSFRFQFLRLPDSQLS